jgi:hypothetical protein
VNIAQPSGKTRKIRLEAIGETAKVTALSGSTLIFSLI